MSTVEKTRLYNIDLCRIFSMLGFLTLHFNRTGILKTAEKGSSVYWFSTILEIIAFSSVNIFAIISGYLGYKKDEQKSFRIIELLSFVLIYCIIITIIYIVIDPSVFTGIKDIIISIFPPLKGRLWYITCYVPLFLFQPYFNKMLWSLSVKQERNLCIIFSTLLGVIPALLKVDFFDINNGYSFLWLAVCYAIGHYFHRSDIKLRIKSAILLIICGGTIQLIIKIIFFYFFHKSSNYLLKYTGPFIIIESIGIFMLFNTFTIRIHNKKFADLITFLSAYSFDVYILHCHPLILDNIFGGRFNWIKTIPSFIVCWLGFIYVLYFLFSIIGYITHMLTKNLHIDKVFLSLSVILDNFMNSN